MWKLMIISGAKLIYQKNIFVQTIGNRKLSRNLVGINILDYKKNQSQRMSGFVRQWWLPDFEFLYKSVTKRVQSTRKSNKTVNIQTIQ